MFNINRGGLGSQPASPKVKLDFSPWFAVSPNFNYNLDLLAGRIGLWRCRHRRLW